jgi:Fe-S-cluster-containing hydrogenase component 2
VRQEEIDDRARLHPAAPLWHEEGACLPLRSRHGECRACATACLLGVLSVTVAAVRLSDGCIGCGRCTAACPTQALTMPGLELPSPAPAPASAPLRIECRKVPERQRAPGTTTLPCLGAATPGLLLARLAAGQEVQMVDRGWCAACEAGGAGEHPARRSLEAAVVWLEAVGDPRRPTLVHDPLPAAAMLPDIPPAPEGPPRLDRRSFFREALQRPAGRHRQAPGPMGGNGRAAYPAERRHPSAERERQLTALRALASQRGQSVPAEFFARLSVDAGCCDRRMCVALCPTAALTVVDAGDSARLDLDADRCIGCGTCVRACPEGAMHLEPHGGSAGVHTLAAHRRMRCATCGDLFAAAAGASGDRALHCQVCTKTQRFIDDARRQLFGAPG